MDLFQLFGTISINNSDANKALDETSEAGKQAESKLGKAFSAVGKGAVAVGKTIGAGMLAGGAAVAGLVTKSVQAYADYEQLVGGVETLFGAGGKSIEEYAESVGKTVEQAKGEYDKLMSAQSTVLINAQSAYMTAGLSMNEYMETVTSFSASLIQSLGGDTEKAASVADRAIRDMSDNANKMGTSMESIQNAYQGFAKQNYTMLDNLKLGYGGTKEEMSRLIKDASKLTAVQKDLGITVDANDMSFGNIVNAISVMQEKMGIAGTTLEEAAGTISGSLGMMKSAWQNVMTAISDENADFNAHVTTFVDSVGAVAENLMPRIEIALNGVVQLIDKLAPVIMEKIPGLFNTLLPSIIQGATNLIQSFVGIIPGLVSTLTSLLPELVSGFTEIVKALFLAIEDLAWEAAPQLIDAIVGAFGTLVDMLPTLLENILYAIEGLAPALIRGLVSAIVKIAEIIPELIQILIGNLPYIFETITQALLDSVPLLIDAVVSLFLGLTENLPQLVSIIVEMIINLTTMLIEQLPTLIPMMVEALVSIITMISEQLPVLIPLIVEAMVSIIYMLIEQLPVIIPMLIEACITITMAIIQALPDILKALTDALPTILQAVWDAIVMIFENIPQWFGQIFEGAVEIIEAAWSVVTGFFKGIWDAICQVFAPVVQWFSDTFGGAWNAVKEVFAPVIDFFEVMFGNAWQVIEAIWSVAEAFFSGIWQVICVVFEPVVNFFKNAFTNAWNAIKNVFSGVSTFFMGIWDKIKNAFSAIGTKIGDAISGAVKAGINGLLGSAEKIINGFLKMINGAIDIINAIPGVSISKVKLVSFTRLAEGGVVDKATPAIFGEDGAEAVVPLEKNTGWLNKVAKQLHEFSVESKNDLADALSNRSVELQQQQVSEMQTLNEKVDGIIDMLIQFFPEMLEALNIQMYLDTGMLVAETAPAMDAALGKIAIKKGRGR